MKTRLSGLALVLIVTALLAMGAVLAGPRAKVLPVVGGPVSHAVPHAGGVPRPDHVLVVVEENHSYSEIIGSSAAPYINGLAQQGALFTNSHGIEHPSQPNYLDLFSGANQGVTDDSCPHTFSTQNLGSEVIGASLTFTGFSEDLPAPGSTVCTSGAYARKHNPWVDFTNVPPAGNLPFSMFPTDYTALPTVGFVIPNLYNDMHSGTIQQGDTWLQQHLDSYVQWASTHNSLLILTWDEDDYTSSNRIPTIFVGPMVVSGQYSESINHYNVLRTVEDMYDLPYAGYSGTAPPITDVWVGGQATATITPTGAPSATPTDTPTPGDTATATYSPTPSDTAAATLSPISSPSATPVESPTPTATPTACSMPFTDVHPTDYFYNAARYLYCHGIISGYGDNTFRPYSNCTRGQLCKIVTLAEGWTIYTPPSPTFNDVPACHPFFNYFETAYHQGIISGYIDGTFKPGNEVNRGQLCKIIVLAQAWPIYIPPTPSFSDVPANHAFYTYIETAYHYSIISGYAGGTFRPDNSAARGQISKIVYIAIGSP